MVAVGEWRDGVRVFVAMYEKSRAQCSAGGFGSIADRGTQTAIVLGSGRTMSWMMKPSLNERRMCSAELKLQLPR